MMFLEGSDHNGYILTVPGNETKDSIVFVHSDYCGHCRNAKPIFTDFCRMYGDYYNCFMVDVDDERGQMFLLKNKLDVRSVPKFLRYRKGMLDTHAELFDRSVDGMLMFMKQ
jgi:thiol-disulfide isomerase/thioredoxin